MDTKAISPDRAYPSPKEKRKRSPTKSTKQTSSSSSKSPPQTKVLILEDQAQEEAVSKAIVPSPSIQRKKVSVSHNQKAV